MVFSKQNDRVRVLLPLRMAGMYDYRIPGDISVEPGMFVSVPLGARQVNGVIWEIHPKSEISEAKMKNIGAVLDVPPMSEAARRFVDWVAQYTLQPSGSVLRMCMNVPQALNPKSPLKGYVLSGPLPARMTPARTRVVDVLKDGPAQTASDLAEFAAVTSSVIKGLFEAGTLSRQDIPADLPLPQPGHIDRAVNLSPSQQQAAEKLVEDVIRNDFSVTLLEGVTGAGKTEVYFEALAEAINSDCQILVLLPEIALSTQWLERFEDRFGVKPVEWHSELRQSERRRNWRAVAEGTAKVVVGARSALFLPFCKLGLIVIDEEHDPSYKQDEGVAYNARDMAIVRARIGAFPIVLATATPSLETRANVDRGKYKWLMLADRYGGAQLPAMKVVDLRLHKPGRQRWISEPLQKAMEENFAAGEQTMLYLNRRGYAPLTLCDSCGHRLQCPHCSSWLVDHRMIHKLQCHHCGFTTTSPQICPECEAEDSFRACGPGIERLAEEAARLFPDISMAVMASDTIAGPKAASELVRSVADGDIQLLIGTQIMAKGYHFPNLTLVGVIDADLGLTGGDLRASERTYQLLSQVSGRAGRSKKAGIAYLQSYMPEHPVIASLLQGKSEDFIKLEMAARRDAGMPPFGRLAALILSSVNPESLLNFAKYLSARAPAGKELSVLGPAPAPLSMIRGRHRTRFLVKTVRQVNIQQIMHQWLDGVRTPADIRIQIDIDPYNFM